MMSNRRLLWVVATSMAAFAVACSGGSGGGGTLPDAGGDAGLDGGGGSDTSDPGAEICANFLDDDGDGAIDCDDSDCDGNPACDGTPDPEICDDTIDNDGDGAADCDDTDCADDPACDVADPEICDDSIDNDGDGDADCDDADCTDDPACMTPTTETSCDDTVDNDEDGDIDCDDSDCTDDPACAPPAEICDDSIDNDEDGDTDCDDTDCTDDVACEIPAEICDDDIDNDEDGDTDCDDADCTDDVACEVPAEICDDDIDNDEDGDIDCDDADCNGETACLCGNGMMDGDEECDDGDLNSDRVGNACRTDCTLPICGDEVLDDAFDEACDGEDFCNDMCEIEDFTAVCPMGVAVEVLDDDWRVAAEPDHYEFTGPLAGASAFDPPATICDFVEPPTGPELVFVFTPTVDGTFLARTDFPDTDVDTMVMVRETDCNTGGIACADDTLTSLGSQVTFDAVAGRPYFIFVDSWAGESGTVHLEVTEIEVVGDGEVCAPPSIICDETAMLACIDGTCATANPPTLTELYVVIAGVVGDEDILLRAIGVDLNEDIDLLDGTIEDPMGVAAPIPFPTTFPSVIYDAGAYEANTRIGGAAGLLEAGYTQFTGSMFDSTGLSSDPLTVTIVRQAEVGEGAMCDNLTAVCTAGLSCLSGMCSADAGTAPTIATLELSWVGPDQIVFDVTGGDVDGDAIGIEIEFLDDMGMPVAELQPPTNFDFNNNTLGDTDFAGQAVAFIADVLAFSDLASAVRVRVYDSAGNFSATSLEADIPWPTRSAAGGPCDVEVQDFICDTGLICDMVVDGEGTCRTLEFATTLCEPTIEAGDVTGITVGFETPATGDILNSVRFIYVYAYTGGGNATSADASLLGFLSYDDNDEGMNQLLGESAGLFAFTFTDGMGGGMPLDPSVTHVDCYVVSYGNQRTPHLRGNIRDEVSTGAACDDTLATNICEVGSFCSGGTCTASNPPVVDSYDVAGTNMQAPTVTIDIVDDGDTLGIFTNYPSETILITPADYIEFAGAPDPLYGEPAGTTSAVFAIDLSFVDETALRDMPILEVQVYDAAGNTSDVVPIDLFLGEGAACDPAQVGLEAIPCQAGLACVDDMMGGGTCEAL